MLFEILKKNEWVEILSEIENYDCYHTYDYHAINRKPDEKGVLLVYRSSDILIALPLLIRPIEGTSYFDATSVYGYSGPIFKSFSTAMDLSDFQQSLYNYFKDQKIISVFSRLNPFIENQISILKNIGNVEALSDVVNIDLTKDIDIQRQLFSKTTKRYLNKVRKLCYTKKSTSQEDILTFVDLYYENMNRVQAKDSYYFEKDYFFNMIDSKDFTTEVIFAIMNETDEIISAAMIMRTNDIIQYHISGTKNDYLHLTPIRLLLDETRISGTKENYKYFNLGGGLGSESDSLLYFKSSFSKDFKKFNVWKYIVDHDIYDSLTLKNNQQKIDNNFFPLYRYKG
ncbi:MAG: GNAT family N-acetyltransferase [Eudoraea sp.]|uniref:GNAT family N-acetyltransferase n=1 Tax=Eudoraea sp. TaxID=1979955 RepID=UPI0032636FCE